MCLACRVPLYGGHASDRGYNAIYMRSAADTWVNQVGDQRRPASPRISVARRTLDCAGSPPASGLLHPQGLRPTNSSWRPKPQVTVLNADNALVLDRVDHSTLRGEATCQLGCKALQAGCRGEHSSGGVQQTMRPAEAPKPSRCPSAAAKLCLPGLPLADVTVGTSVRRWAATDATWRREGHHAIALAGCHAVLVTR